MRFLGREVMLELTLREFVRSRFVAYESVQNGLPDARHERHFEPTERGLLFRIAVADDPRPGVARQLAPLLVGPSPLRPGAADR